MKWYVAYVKKLQSEGLIDSYSNIILYSNIVIDMSCGLNSGSS